MLLQRVICKLFKNGSALESFCSHRHISTKEIPKITVPIKMARNIEKAKMKKMLREQAVKKRKNAQLLISCKQSEFNFYKGQKFDETNTKELASHGWKHYKSAMAVDYFTIKAFGENPALGKEEDRCLFSDLNINKRLCEQLNKIDIKVPTDIQKKMIPQVMRGTNILCAAQTGSGKTLAYLLPIIQILMSQNETTGNTILNGPKAIILVPSRELVEQLTDVASEFTDFVNIKCLMGGLGTKAKLIYSQPEYIDILISTPGVLQKFLFANKLKISQLQHVVLDEADTLLDDSFINETQTILKRCHVHGGRPSDDSRFVSTSVQINLVSATMPRNIQESLGSIISLESLERVKSDNLHCILPHVTQTFKRIKVSEKPAELLKIVKDSIHKKIPMMIFCNKHNTSYFVHHFLEENNIHNTVLNADLDPKRRLGKFDEFQTEKSDILVCTDIASRGLDTIRARHIVNYEFPSFMSDYIHRAGRVGRVGAHGSGVVTSFICRKWDVELLWKIETAYRKQAALYNVDANIKRKLAGSDDL